MKRAPSLLVAAALLVTGAMAAAAKEGAAETPRPNVTFAGVPRSVEKELLKLNASGKKFQCLDAAKTQIPMDKFNDDYCDCPNGADEPGTCACAPQGRFYCRNKGYVGMYIPASRVNDTVCDCCDGSDESPQRRCPNTCTEIAEAARSARAEQIAVFEAGWAKRQEYVKEGVGLTETRLEEMASARAKLVAEEGRLKEATKAKDAAEAKEKKEQDAKVAAKLVQLKEGLKFAALNKDGVQELYAKLDGRKGGKVVGALLSEMRRKLGIKEEDEDEDEDDDGLSDEEEEEEEEGGEKEEDDRAVLEKVAGGDEEGKGELGPELIALLESVEEGVDVETAEAAAVRGAFNAAQSAVGDLEKKIKELEDLAEEDFGDEKEFAPLKGKCFKKRVAQYTYELCPYKESYQKEGHSPIGTSLGKWAGLERSQPASAFSNSQHNAPVSLTFKFRDGQQCWNGPRRSLTVTVVCGTEDEVESVDEPAVCEYTMVFRTPAACAPVPEDWKAEVAWENEEDEEEEEESPRTEL